MIDKGERTKYFVKSLRLVLKFEDHIKDPFFYQRFSKLVDSFIETHLAWIEDRRDNVAQYVDKSQKLLASSNAISDLLDELVYLGFFGSSTPLLDLKRNLLLLKLGVLKSKTEIYHLENNSNRQERNDSRKSIKADVPDIREDRKGGVQLNNSQQKILEFIKSSPDRRTKDIIYEFNALSDRSVKRNLNNLLQVGLIKRRVENKAVYYSATK